MISIIIILPLFIIKGCSVIFNDLETVEPILINVYLHKDNKTVSMPLEEYVTDVLMAEMPAEFETEALKAQAIAARTYAYGRLKGIYRTKEDELRGADICTDSAHCQAWINKDNAIICKADDPIDLAEKISLLLADNDLAEKISQQAYNDVQSYSWDNRAKKLWEFLD